MGDSEDEYDRKHRDKFRGERTESYQRGGSDRRDFQRSSGMSARSEFRTGGFSRAQDMAPPNKRGRYDWGDDRRGMGGYGHEGASYKNSYSPAWQQHYPSSYSQPHSHPNTSRNSSSDGVETQPAMMSFKSFLQTQDDNITDKDALKSYADYKLEFKRQQLHEFFVVHKEEEWFKIKYHPEEAVKNKEELATAIQRRVEIFQEFMDAGRFEKMSMDVDKSEELVKLLDSVVIRLEGGSELDLLALEEADIKEEKAVKREPVAEPAAPADKDKDKDKVKEDKDVDKETPAEEVAEPEPSLPAVDEPEAEKPEEGTEPVTAEPAVAAEPEAAAAPEVPEDKKEGDESSDDSDSEVATPAGDKAAGGGEAADAVEPPPPGLEEPMGAENGEAAEKEAEPMEQETDALSDSGEEDTSDEKTEDTKESKEDGEKEGDDKSGRSSPEDNAPRCLHRVTSILLRNLAPTVTKQEVAAVCKRFPEFLRVAMSDPQPERRWFRRGWVTFKRHANINDICWNLNNVRLRKCELGAVVNRDLTRRIRPANSVASLAEVVRNDIKLAALVVQRLDGRAGLWGAPSTGDGEDSQEEDRSLNFALTSKNPLLKNITEHLIETASAEEDELLGAADDEADRPSEDRPAEAVDEGVVRALDRLLIYLRVVHSLDFYNHCQYVNEDAMPNRCGIMHVRAPPPSSKQVFPQEVSDYRSSFEQKIGQFLQAVPKISDEEYRGLGPKEPEAEVEKFVKANTQELSEAKWLCPLSGKKFKGPDFIRKHIFNKFGEKLDEVRQEVAYYNNYLRDPRRPQLPEHPANRTANRRSGPSDREGYGSSGQPPFPHGGGYGGGYGHRQGYPGPSGQGPPRSNRGGSRGWAPYGNANGGNRRIVSYNDLDAPGEPEFNM